ncbi:chlorophyll synthesis pathway protein BchC [Allopontixanthobacter sediminis]|uniref:Chlorophyll synthesis pathway protein BchC n=1 Tax=Allopontixanthobacter sediminis TaxID=1689985 RepID=A0A845B1E0_9SPHN|nr:chlorophyll synthesis pathway protein BchC [Allopontixanthobacter sediminis]MXP45553.1 chlorophyll synthesis pathway protein BchC [Allopontixanthobacter sediminis]
MKTAAIILDAPGRLALRETALNPMGAGDVQVDIHWSGVSTGTEKLFWTGKMPNFPGMGYPLVPGYESVGRVVDAGESASSRIGEWVFVPGANCYRDARGLFGGSARTVILPSARALPVSEELGREGILYALAATALHAIAHGDAPELIVGHGVLGRLLARLAVASGAKPPVVWDTNSRRQAGAQGYDVIHPDDDDRRDYRNIYDVSGDAASIESFIGCLAKGGELVLAGFYTQPISFAFPPAFQREARLRIAAEWQPDDLTSVNALIGTGALDLTGLITNVEPASSAETAYPAAFEDSECLKMVLDWREAA